MLLSKPSKELAIRLQTKVMLERANTEYVVKHDGFLFKQFLIIANNKNQFVLNYGPGIENYEFNLTQDEAFEGLAKAVMSHGDRIRFNALAMPVRGGIDHYLMDLNSDVIVRVIEYYEIKIDEILTRYDVLVEKVIKNA